MFDWYRPIYFVAWCFGMLLHRGEVWFYTRSLRWLAQGLPALFVAGTCVTVVASFSRGPRVHVVERYNAAIDEALRGADFETAELFLHKLLQIDEGREDVRYRLAILAEQRGEVARADDMMAQLAPDDRFGHPGAHFWRAKHWLAGQQQVTAYNTGPLIHHLKASLKDPSNSVEAQALLGQLLFAQRKFTEATAHLSEIVSLQPQWRVLLAKVYLSQGNRSLANRELVVACEHFQKLVDANADDTNSRIVLAEAWALQGRLERTERILLDGFGHEGANLCREALAAIYVMRFDTESSSQSGEGSQLKWLQKALDMVPNHVEALLRLTKFLTHEGDDGAIAKAAIEDVLANGEAPARLHLILGTNAAGEGEMGLAKLHLEQARRLEPRSPVILNNLAWVVAHQDPPELELALDLANEAIEAAPQNPEIRETRGQILVQLERWSEALADLELALVRMKGNPKLHATVAVVYERLNVPALAERHRQLAENAEHEGGGGLKNQGQHRP